MNYPTQEGLRALGITVREHYDESGVTLQDARRIIDWHNAQAAKQAPEGWKLAPIDPTAEMLRAAHLTYNDSEYAGYGSIYKAMLASAPTPPLCVSKSAESETQAGLSRTSETQSDDAKDAARYQEVKRRAYVSINPHKQCLWVLRGVIEIDGEGFDAAIDALKGGE